MLKALELVGFKSFADKTRFEFPSGITVVVGPNGSGKSNVVDAIKWVLGEQSVKSLRGKEMADVIFNGSGNRRPLNSAEATISFDNKDGRLAIETPVVHVTRRVYRSGEGEYLINRQPCRLRDIRDLFAGTGAATQAYSVIEQGKVDVLLQSSPRDRRVIFEEAAGISRFKAKKLEAIRRLARVEQNLLRLSDIVDEVDSRLRSVRMQAAKARRYKEHNDRLQELRTQVGLTDWRALTAQLDQFAKQLEGHQTELAEAGAKAENCEAEVLTLEHQIVEAEQLIRASDAQVAENRERIASLETAIDHERRSSRDLEEQIARHRRHLRAMNTRAGDLDQQLDEVAKELEVANADLADRKHRLAVDQQALEGITGRRNALQTQRDEAQTATLEAMRKSAALGNDIGSLESKIAALESSKERSAMQCESLESQQQEIRHRCDELSARRDRKETEHKRATEEVAQLREQLVDDRRQLTEHQRHQTQLQGKLAGATERAALLAELEKSFEGVASGSKQVLLTSKNARGGPLAQVRGLVAELLQADVKRAPLIDVALGERAQYVAVSGAEQVVEELQQQESIKGRVTFLQLDSTQRFEPADRIDLAGQPGVVGRADTFVETAPGMEPLARRLLGRTWLVDTLETALHLSRTAGRGINFVTTNRELLTSAGELAVGPVGSTGGLVSRRSELRALKNSIEQLNREIGRAQTTIAALEQNIGDNEQRLEQFSADHRKLTDELSELRLQAASAEERLDQLDKQLESLQNETRAAGDQAKEASEQLSAKQNKLAEIEDELKRLESQRDEAQQALQAVESEYRELAVATTEAQVELAKGEQRVDSLQARQAQIRRDQDERVRAVEETRTHLSEAFARASKARSRLLTCESEVAELYLEKEQLASKTVGHINQRETLKQARADRAAEASAMRRRIHRLEEEIHRQEMASGEVEHQRTTLTDRLREDYGIDLAELEHQPTDEELHEREAVEAEISELRRKINNIGNVNLDALDELEELESRHASLAAQYDDLTKAKAALERIIEKINADSRRLFSETLETVREHFRTLFRKLFGGGRADIVLEDEEDILETGIEIVARPPGKEPRSISLLSGGEKTLTCVALLMAIFRSRPSPFCVLDEVDAALDEANIDRFVGVLREFLEWTQFIVVTHSKRTMTCASTLYGVTMQESGVSKRVSVRFEDVSETGEIDARSVAREEESAAMSEDSVSDDAASDEDPDDESQAA